MGRPWVAGPLCGCLRPAAEKKGNAMALPFFMENGSRSGSPADYRLIAFLTAFPAPVLRATA